MLSFYPGPSKVYPQIVEFIQEAQQSGLLSMNHRSQVFMDVCQKAIAGLKTKLHIPNDYTIAFTSSATEVWEMIAQSFHQAHQYHIFNGSFGEKWFDYTAKIKLWHARDARVLSTRFPYNDEKKLDHSEIYERAEIICLTLNETANGTALSADFMAQVRQQYPQKLIAVDATSGLGGMMIDFNNADIWFASVQKCLGLPAGLGIVILSPQAVHQAYEVHERNHYNSLAAILDNIRKYQTPYTPNVLNIYLLMRVMQMVDSIDLVSQRLKQQADFYYQFLAQFTEFKLLIDNAIVRSPTVIAVSASEEKIKDVKQKAQKQNIILGNGYGEWKETTFRIANFPAITADEIAQLQDFLQKNLQ
ncbi:MAG: aminotransferase class V-fold PLP-dependent enzyme [Microscillaceae bacterium]|jgi:phosphoserine aminotransferase|nr:aminotransferase class V-fold PLP-dependent enzyme [Microscillaceae bacterium]